MGRKEEIDQATEKFDEDRLYEKLHLHSNELSADDFQEYARDFIKPLDNLFKKIKSLQEQGLKSTIYLINIYFLHHTFQNGCLELLAEAYDKSTLFDKNPVSIQFSPRKMSDEAKNDWDNYVKHMNSSVIQIKYHEMHPYYLKLAESYKKIIFFILSDFMMIVSGLESFQEIEISDGLVIGYGEYGCACSPLYGEATEGDNEGQ